MLKAQRKFYTVITLLLTGSWVWTLFSLQHPEEGMSLCFFKNMTSLPCPACGTTRSVTAIFHQHWSQGLLYNPFGYFAVAMLFILPVWLLIDALYKKPLLYKAYQYSNSRINNNKVVMTMIILIIAGNWIWNLYKSQMI